MFIPKGLAKTSKCVGVCFLCILEETFYKTHVISVVPVKRQSHKTADGCAQREANRWMQNRVNSKCTINNYSLLMIPGKKQHKLHQKNTTLARQKKQHLFDGLQYNFLFRPDVDNMRLQKWIWGRFESHLRRKEKKSPKIILLIQTKNLKMKN